MNAPSQPATGTERLHGLDALRAVMMLLGLVLHSMVSYGPLQSMGDMWPFLDIRTSPLADLALVYIHTFRMPVFFVTAGFFAAMLYQRRGAGGLMRNRLSRIGIPMVVGFVVLYPLTRIGFAFALAAKADMSTATAAAVAQLQQPFADANTIHLWFLYYLLLFYVFALLCVQVVSKLPATWRERGHAAFVRASRHTWRSLIFAVPTALTLLPMETASLDTNATFIPAIRTLAAYFVFFGYGWLLYGARELLSTFTRSAWTQCVVATALFVPNFLALRMVWGHSPHAGLARLVAVGTGALMMWLFIFGMTGLFLRYFKNHNPRIRYMVDASYWLYLLHLPLAIWLPGMLAQVNVHAMIKAGVVLAVMTPILLVSYHVLVRPTFIGKVLNGRRYPAPLPFFGKRGT